MEKPGQCQVLVVGAGPTGLMAAVLLKRAGVDVRIVEHRMEATRESRAFAVQARSMELMQTLGLSDEMLARGVICNSVELHVKGQHYGGIDADMAGAADTPFPYIFMIPQSETEDILIAELERLGGTVERGIEVKGVSQDAHGVTTSMIQSDGAEAEVNSAYVIGADGSRSVVREKSGIGWAGELLPQRFLLADCKVEWPLDHNRFRVFLNGKRIGLFLPLYGKKMSRIMATDLSGSFGAEDASKPAPLDLTEMAEGFTEATGLPVTLSNPVWVTRYRAHHRNVDRYSQGRVFVAGDAAHIHSPAGGQGMNTGFQDVENLAWKLAQVLRGANATLLDSYNSERLPVGHMVVKSTGRLFAAAAGQKGIKAWLRDTVAPFLIRKISRTPAIQRKAFFRISQRNIVYSQSRYVAEGAGLSAGPVAGARAPNARISDASDVFSLLKGYHFTILAFSREPLAQEEMAMLKAKLDALADALPRAQAHLVARAAIGRDASTVFTSDPDAFDRYGVPRGSGKALYVIRPDGYVAWRSAGIDLSGCAEFLKRFS